MSGEGVLAFEEPLEIGVREFDVGEGDGFVLAVGFCEDGGFGVIAVAFAFESADGDTAAAGVGSGAGFDESVDFIAADAVEDAGAGWEVGFGVGVDVAEFGGGGGEDRFFEEEGLSDGARGFEGAEVIGPVEEVVPPAVGLFGGDGVDLVVIHEEVAVGVVLPCDDVDPAARFSVDDVVDVAGGAGGVEVEEVEDLFDVFFGAAEFMTAHAGLERDEAGAVADEGHFDVQFGAIGVGDALDDGEFEIGGDFAFGLCDGVAFEVALDVACLDDAEAPEFDFLDHGAEDTVLVAGVAGDDDALFIGLVFEELAEGEIDLGVHEDDVGFFGDGGEAEVGGRGDGVGAFDEDVEFEVREGEEAGGVEGSPDLGFWGTRGEWAGGWDGDAGAVGGGEAFGDGIGGNIGDEDEIHARGAGDLPCDAEPHGTASDNTDPDILTGFFEGPELVDQASGKLEV